MNRSFNTICKNKDRKTELSSEANADHKSQWDVSLCIKGTVQTDDRTGSDFSSNVYLDLINPWMKIVPNVSFLLHKPLNVHERKKELPFFSRLQTWQTVISFLWQVSENWVWQPPVHHKQPRSIPTDVSMASCRRAADSLTDLTRLLEDLSPNPDVYLRNAQIKQEQLLGPNRCFPNKHF